MLARIFSGRVGGWGFGKVGEVVGVMAGLLLLGYKSQVAESKWQTNSNARRGGKI
jgi:hypothetical protein